MRKSRIRGAVLASVLVVVGGTTVAHAEEGEPGETDIGTALVIERPSIGSSPVPETLHCEEDELIGYVQEGPTPYELGCVHIDTFYAAQPTTSEPGYAG